jgi:hypothetical protein
MLLPQQAWPKSGFALNSVGAKSLIWVLSTVTEHNVGLARDTNDKVILVMEFSAHASRCSSPRGQENACGHPCRTIGPSSPVGGAPGVRRSKNVDICAEQTLAVSSARLTVRAGHISNDYTGWTTVARCSIASIRQWRVVGAVVARQERNLERLEYAQRDLSRRYQTNGRRGHLAEFAVRMI